MPYGTAHIAAMIRGPLAAPVVRATTGQRTRGFLDDGTRLVVDDAGQSYEVDGVALTYVSDDAVLAGLQQDETLTVDGTAYQTGSVNKHADGAVRVVTLRKV